MAQKIPPELEQLLVKYQQVENQLASVITQKGVVASQLREVERALEIIQNLKEDSPVYKNTGFVLVKVSRDEVIKELNDRKEELQIRLTSLERMESTLRKQLEELKKQLDKYRGGLGIESKAG